MKGKLVWANWDMEELIAKKEKIAKVDLLTVGLFGVSFAGWGLTFDK